LIPIEGKIWDPNPLDLPFRFSGVIDLKNPGSDYEPTYQGVTILGANQIFMAEFKKNDRCTFRHQSRKACVNITFDM